MWCDTYLILLDLALSEDDLDRVLDDLCAELVLKGSI